MSRPLTERNAAIAQRRRDGATLREIGDEFGISYERVRQLTPGIPPLCVIHFRRVFNAVSTAARLELRSTEGTTSPHGSLRRYRLGCRCADCAEANRALHRSLKGRPVPNHGNSGYMNYGCRCDICKRANSAHQKARRARSGRTRGGRVR